MTILILTLINSYAHNGSTQLAHKLTEHEVVQYMETASLWQKAREDIGNKVEEYAQGFREKRSMFEQHTFDFLSDKLC